MNTIERLSRTLAGRFPGARIEIDKPEREGGAWFLDIELNGHDVTVQWNQDGGYGISSRSEAGLGEGPDERYADENTVLDRVHALLVGRHRTGPQQPESLSRLREACGITQVELARRLGVQQAAVSKLERRPDLHLSTLRSLIAALGGHLEVRAVFGENDVHMLELDGCES